MQTYLVAYDLSDDKERHKVSRTLAKYGFRYQKSVFEVQMDRNRLSGLRRDLAALDLQSGFVAIVPTGRREEWLVAGTQPPSPADVSAFIV